MRKDPFIIGEYYHIYNRGTDKRIIFTDRFDLQRFQQSMEEFNTIEPIGSIFRHNRHKNSRHRMSTINDDEGEKLVDIIVFSLNPNHYHLILSPLVESGIEKYMQKLGIGYTKYFNEKYNRTGVLFQGKYKSILIKTDDYLMYLSAYINLNNRIHFQSKNSRHPMSTINNKKLFYTSSWEEYIGEKNTNFCNKEIILDRYKNIKDYKEFAESVAQGIIEKRTDREIDFDEDLLIEKLK
ncbi:MAG: transposase [Candidatus Pacebacteria bacterium]|nr:transposase [Candidatus Paceibacterota bacterium]